MWHSRASWFLFTVTLSGAVVLVGAGCGGPEIEDEDVVVSGPVVIDDDPGPYGGGPVEENTATLEEALERPSVHNGATVFGQATVFKVVSERGFWIENEGGRIFTVIREREPADEQVELKAGHILQLSGELQSTDDLGAIEGEIDPRTQQVLERQDFFVVVSANTIEIVTRGVAQQSVPN